MPKQSNIGAGKFAASIADASRILKGLRLHRGDNLMWCAASEEFLKVSKQDNYKLMYDTAIEHYDYNIMLKDGSIFQFEIKENEDLRYAYIQAPYNYVSFEDFLLTFMDENEIPKEESELMDLMSTFENEYEQMLAEQGINGKVIYFRYDVDSVRYMPNIHSYAHLHIGISNDIRIPCASRLTPVSFVIFVVKQAYKACWEKYIIEDEKKNELLHFAGEKDMLEDEQWKEDESKELVLV